MRIHVNTLTINQLYRAAQTAGVSIERDSWHGSRSHHEAVEVTLSGSGNTGGQWGNSGSNGAASYKAATWDEYGIFLNAVFAADPSARVPLVYENAEMFHWVTGGRYRTLTPESQHLRHNWLSGDTNGRSCTGSYYVQSCKCGAIVRRMAHGRDWYAEVASEFDGVI